MTDRKHCKMNFASLKTFNVLKNLASPVQMGKGPVFLGELSRQRSCHLPYMAATAVFTMQLIRCGRSGRVRVGWGGGQMPAKCSHHDLMRWFSFSSEALATLCNSETPTRRFPWPDCVTSASVLVGHVSHNPVKHAEWLP